MPVVVRVIDDPDPDVAEEEGHDLGAAPPVWPSDDELAVAARRDPIASASSTSDTGTRSIGTAGHDPVRLMTPRI